MPFTIQRAKPGDAALIANLLRAVWPAEKADPAQAASALENPQHVVHVAQNENQTVGLVSGFPTETQDGKPRWEVDLLAVHPNFRQRGIARNLIQVCTNDGLAAGTLFARALIQATNTASQRAFAASGYEMQPQSYIGYLSRAGLSTHAATTSHSLHVIPVRTLTYTGAWIEGTPTEDALQAARSLQAERGWERIGALVTSDPHATGF